MKRILHLLGGLLISSGSACTVSTGSTVVDPSGTVGKQGKISFTNGLCTTPKCVLPPVMTGTDTTLNMAYVVYDDVLHPPLDARVTVADPSILGAEILPQDLGPCVGCTPSDTPIVRLHTKLAGRTEISILDKGGAVLDRVDIEVHDPATLTFSIDVAGKYPRDPVSELKLQCGYGGSFHVQAQDAAGAELANEGGFTATSASKKVTLSSDQYDASGFQVDVTSCDSAMTTEVIVGAGALRAKLPVRAQP